TGDHDVAAGIDKTPGADVRQFGSRAGAQVVDFDQSDASCGLLPTLDHGVGAGGKGSNECSLGVIGRLQAGSLNLRFLVLHPVVVLGNDYVVAIQFDDRVGQRAGNPGAGQRRTQAADEHVLEAGADDDETAIEYVVGGRNVHSRGNG